MFSLNKKETCINNHAFVESRKKEEQKKLDSKQSECRSLIVAMSKYIHDPQSYESNYQKFEYSGGFECDFKKLLKETNRFANISVKDMTMASIIYDDPYPQERGSYFIKRTVVGEKVEYEIQ